jgi:hypothetical protein
MMGKMVKYIVVLLLALITGILLVGCGRSSSTAAATVTSIPHSDGNQWVYRNSMSIGTSEFAQKNINYFNGTTVLPNGLRAHNYCLSVESYAATAMKHTTPKAMTICLPDNICLLVNDSGVYCYGSINSPTTEGSQILPLPLAVGNKWQRDRDFYCEAIAAEDVTVPAGTFKAIKVVLTNSTSDEVYYEWWADGVGRVKMYEYIPDLFFVNNGNSNQILYVGTQELLSKNF